MPGEPEHARRSPVRLEQALRVQIPINPSGRKPIMLIQYATTPSSLPITLGLSNNFESLARDFNRLQNDVVNSASKYFEVKGELLIFKNTDELAKNIHAATVKLNDAAQTAIRTLNNYAATVRSMDDRRLCAYVLARFMELRSNDASMLQLLGLLAAAEVSLASGEITRLAESMLKKLARLIEEKSRPLAKAANSPTKIRLAVWAALKNNAFNWKKQQFEASGAVAKFANWYKLNPAVSKAKTDIESVVLGRVLASALSRVGLPGPAIEPTANYLVAVAMSEG
jgi:hypothetical protein